MKICCACGEAKPTTDFNRNRRTKDGFQSRCRECFRSYMARWRDENHEHYRELCRRSNANNAPARKASSKRYYVTHRDRKIEYAREYDAAHPFQPPIRTANFRARKLGLPEVLTESALRARWEYYAGRCWCCGGAANAIDHVIPFARGGRNFASNVRPICQPCNNRKYAKLPRELDWLSA